jgi:hypothetical protein
MVLVWEFVEQPLVGLPHQVQQLLDQFFLTFLA